MKKQFTATVLAALLSTTVLADTSSMNTSVTGMGVLENDYVKAGVNGTTGTLGSGGNTSPGLLYDSTGSGTFNTSYDYLTPGSPFDGFSVMVDGTNYTNNNASGSTQITGDGNGLTDGDGTLSWTGGVTSVFDITNTYSLGTTAEHIEIGSSITMGTDATDVYFGRFIDPDARAASGDSSSTDNVLGYGVIPDSNVAFSEALSSRYALGLYSTDTNVDAGITGWTTDANSYTENAVDGDGSLTNTGDNTIGLSWHWSTVSSGDVLTASYAYIFGPSAFDAADTAIAAGAGGGDTTTTDSWGTLEDVGSATDAAEGTAEPVITYSDPVVDTDLPVLTQSQTTHDSSVAAGVQTIDRETTTIVTTPMEIITYTDGVETSRASTDSAVVTTVTDPGAFTGRMDQVDQMLALNAHRNIGIRDGIGGGRITHDMGNGYSAESNVAGLGISFVGDNQLTLSIGANKIDTTMTGEGSTGTMETTAISVGASKHLDDKGVTVSGMLNTAGSELSYARTIGDFGAEGATEATNNWGTVTVEKSAGQLRPFAGYTIGTNRVDAFSETGDVQALLLHEAVDESYKYATVGINLDTGLISASIARDFDDAETMRMSLGIDKDINERINFNAKVNKTTAGDNDSTYLTAGINIKF
jgi:hypothetical protein